MAKRILVVLLLICTIFAMTLLSNTIDLNHKVALNDSTPHTSSDRFLTGDNTQEETTSYFNKRFSFSVEFPKSWTYKVDEEEIIPNKSASPDSGIEIFVESKEMDKLSVYGIVSPVILPDESSYQKLRFITNSGVVGDLLSRDIEGRKELYLLIKGPRYHYSAVANTSLETYAMYETKILSVLESIHIVDK